MAKASYCYLVITYLMYGKVVKILDSGIDCLGSNLYLGLLSYVTLNDIELLFASVFSSLK